MCEQGVSVAKIRKIHTKSLNCFRISTTRGFFNKLGPLMCAKVGSNKHVFIKEDGVELYYRSRSVLFVFFWFEK